MRSIFLMPSDVMPVEPFGEAGDTYKKRRKNI